MVQDGEILFQADIIDVSSGFSDDSDTMEDTPTQKELPLGLDALLLMVACLI